MLRTVAQRAVVQPGSAAAIGRRFAGGGPIPIKKMTLAQAERAATQLTSNMANLDESIAKMKASLPENSTEIEATAPEIVKNGYDSTSGVARICPMVIKTPWNSDGLDGGSHATLIKRAEKFKAEFSSELQALNDRIASLK